MKTEATTKTLLIATATEHLIKTITGSTDDEINAGIETAVDSFINDQTSAATAIQRGVTHARKLIKQRRLDNVIDFLAFQRWQRSRAQGTKASA